MAGGPYSYNRFSQFNKLDEGAKPDFLDMDKDGNKKESFKKAVKDKKQQKECTCKEWVESLLEFQNLDLPCFLLTCKYRYSR